MKSFRNIQSVKREIDSYEKHFTGAPLLIGLDAREDYVTLLGLLRDDFGKQIIHMSDSCKVDFPPNPALYISVISNAAKAKPVVWSGAVQASMLYGQKETEQFLVNLLGSSFGGPVTILCPYCVSLLNNIGRNYTKLGYNIIVVNADNRDIPRIQVNTETSAYTSRSAVQGIGGLLRVLEDAKYGEVIQLKTACKLSYLAGSMYPVSEGVLPFQFLCQKEPGIAANMTENNGTPEQWLNLAIELQKADSLSDLCKSKLSSVHALQNSFGDYLSGDQDVRFLCFVCLKVFYSTDDNYLAYCLRQTETVNDLEEKLYSSILKVSHTEHRFSAWIRQRSRIISLLDENSARMKDFCERATIKGKDILWYLSDETEEERAAIIHALCTYSYTDNELNIVLCTISPQLFQYLQKFVFDEFNTRVMESDAYVRPLLTDYFHRYKIQKLTNHQDREFVEIVEKEAKVRSFTKLQARSAIVKKIDKNGAQPYFFDALGAEFLSFIEAKSEDYGMQFECFVGHCNLPSITSKNKEFYTAFPEGSILKEEGLDELKHHGTKYDFQFTTEPLHLFDELAILDRDLKKMSSALAMGKCKRIIILSDHGASRLAVTYRSENKKLELAEPGKHSGRCCPADVDPGIEFATYEDGFVVLANYERFKGSRKADVETHGGASLEETVVPVIVLTLKPKEQQLFFVESVVICNARDGSSIKMFANPPLKTPRMIVNNQCYEGKFDGDKHNVVFEMPDIRRKGHHEAEIYDGGVKISVLTFETKRQTGMNQLL